MQKGREKTRKKSIAGVGSLAALRARFQFYSAYICVQNETKGKRKGGDDDYDEEEEGECENSHGKEN